MLLARGAHVAPLLPSRHATPSLSQPHLLLTTPSHAAALQLRRRRAPATAATKQDAAAQRATQSQQQQQQSPQQNSPQQELECVGTGMEVDCEYVDPAATPWMEDRPEQLQQQDQQVAPDLLAAFGPLGLLVIISPFFFWGTSMVAMKGLLPYVSPLLMGSFRLLPSGFILVAVAAAQGRPPPASLAAWAWVAAFALVDGAAFQGFLAEGLQRCSAGLGSVIIDSQPLTVALLAALLFGEALTPASIGGLALGVAGLLLLELPEDSVVNATSSLTHLGDGSTSSSLATLSSSTSGLQLPSLETLSNTGELWMFAAAQSMALGTVMVRYVTRYSDPVMATGWHMIMGGVLLLGLALREDPAAITEALQGLGPQDIASSLYVSLLGGAASYGIFFWLASSKGNLTALSSLTFLTPVFAAVTGYLALGEVLTLPQIIGGAVTLSAVFLISGSKQKKAQEAESGK